MPLRLSKARAPTLVFANFVPTASQLSPLFCERYSPSDVPAYSVSSRLSYMGTRASAYPSPALAASQLSPPFFERYTPSDVPAYSVPSRLSDTSEKIVGRAYGP